jgi:hypothetical protein
LKKQLAERLAEIESDRDESGTYVVSGNAGAEPVGGKLTAIRSERVPAGTLEALTPQLGVRIGDTINEETVRQVRENVRRILGEQFRAVFLRSGEGDTELVIVGP